MSATATWLDRAIGWLDPGAGLRRQKRRIALDGARAYAAAAVGRNTDGWRTSGTSADAEIAIAGPKLRDRSRDLVRNNPYAAKAVSVLATNIVGEGIVPRADTGNDAEDKRINAAFEEWAEQCDADGQLDFYGLQTLAVREMVEGGEVLTRRRWRRATDGYAVPIQLQLIESDFLDNSRDGFQATGNNVIGGIEFNQIGQRVAYWMFREHPGNSFANSLGGMYESVAVPAADVAHLYEKQRTQTRGVPWMAPVVRRIRDVDDYDFAESIRKKIEASLVGVVTSDDETEEGVAPRVETARGRLIEKFEPGLIAYLRGGKDIKFNQPAAVGGYEEYKRVTAREISTGARVPYELLTNDLSVVNFSSSRVGIVEFRRLCRVMQWQVVIPMQLQPWWNWFGEAAFLAGRISSPNPRCEWAPPKWEAIQPHDDAIARMIEIRLGIRSWKEVVAETGRSPEAVMAEVKWFNDVVDAMGITLDADPRRTSMKGALQKLIPEQDGVDLVGGPSPAPKPGN